MLKRIGLSLLVLLTIILAVAAFLNYLSQAQLEARLTEIRDAGDPATLADLVKPEVAPEENAATYLRRAASDADKLYGSIVDATQTEDFDWVKGLDDANLKTVEEGFAKFPLVMRLIEEACQQEYYVWPYDESSTTEEFTQASIESVQLLRMIARVMGARGRQLVSRGEPDEACGVYLDLLRISRLHEAEPLLISFLANMGTRSLPLEALRNLLEQHQLKPATYAAIEAELLQHEEMQSFVWTLKSERAFGIESFRAAPGVGMLLQDWVNYLDVMQSEIALGAVSVYEIDQPPAAKVGSLASTVTPAIAASRTALCRTRAFVRTLRIANAAKQLGLANPLLGASDLHLPAEVFVDPFTGKPLQIRATQAGWLIYSVGANQQDDGGDFSTMKDVGIGPVLLD